MLDVNKRSREISNARRSKRQKKEEEEDDVNLLLQGMALGSPSRRRPRLSMLNDDQSRVYKKITGHLLHELDHELDHEKGACKCTDIKPFANVR